jgi:hypothetical protein
MPALQGNGKEGELLGGLQVERLHDLRERERERERENITDLLLMK